MAAPIKKGEHRPLNVTKKARHRIMAGLGWDPADEPGFLDKAKALATRKDTHHDLDLVCLTYDKDLHLLESISADPGNTVGADERIYHSGDNEEGYGEGDDEEISAELKELDNAVHHIVFLALIRTTHTFKDIAEAEIRLADGYTNHNFVSEALTHEDGRDLDAFAFAHIYRDQDNEKGWRLHYIGEYMRYGSLESISDSLKAHLKEE